MTMWRSVVAAALAVAGLAYALPSTHTSLVVEAMGAVESARGRSEGTRDLVFMHVPYNAGDTVAKVAALGHVGNAQYMVAFGLVKRPDTTKAWQDIRALAQPNPEFWADLNPDIQLLSSATGGQCPMFYTPQKYWPTDLASQYFGSKTVFGIIRDPYDRLVSIFQGNEPLYPEYFPSASNNHTCNVNGAVRRMIEDYKVAPFAQWCRFLPQVEYFHGFYGVKHALHLNDFPYSVNDLLANHGYDNMNITDKDEVSLKNSMNGPCNHMTSGDLDTETKRMVKELYMDDFNLLCDEFDYCV